MKTLLMSIKPRYSKRIFEGSKRFELRRTPIKLSPGDRIVVYASAPTMAVVGHFTVGEVLAAPPQRLWAQHSDDFGIREEDYSGYFAGADTAYAIRVTRPEPVAPVPLSCLRSRISGFRPPQSYMIWRSDLGALLDHPTTVPELAPQAR